MYAICNIINHSIYDNYDINVTCFYFYWYIKGNYVNALSY